MTAPSEPPVPYRVLARETETADMATLVLEPVRSALPPFAPGQFAMVYAFGVGDTRPGARATGPPVPLLMAARETVRSNVVLSARLTMTTGAPGMSRRPCRCA